MHDTQYWMLVFPLPSGERAGVRGYKQRTTRYEIKRRIK